MGRYLIVILLSACCIFSCKKKDEKTTLMDPSKDFEILSTYFSMATTGMISSSEPLHYVLINPLGEIPSDSILQKWIRLEPAVKGTVTLQNQNALIFTPSSPLKPGTEYTVHLNFDVFGQEGLSGEIKYVIRTLDQAIQVVTSGYFIRDDDSEVLLANLSTADVVTQVDLLKCFQSDAKSIDIQQLDKNQWLLEFIYPEGFQKNSFIKYDGKSIQAVQSGSLKLFDINHEIFTVVFSEYDEKTREYEIYFSQKMNPNQDLSGLIRLDNGEANYTINNNHLRIYIGADPSRTTAQLQLDQHIQSEKGKILDKEYAYDIKVSSDLPEISFLEDGHYLPSSGDFKIPIKARGLVSARLSIIEIKQERVAHAMIWNHLSYLDPYSLRMYGKLVYDETISLKNGEQDKDGWRVYGIDLSERLSKNPGSIYYISMDFGPENTQLDCKSKLLKYDYRHKLPGKEYFRDKDAYYYHYDNYYYEDYNYNRTNDPCDISFYLNKQAINRLVICTDFSAIVKKTDQEYHFAIQDLMKLKPIQNADLTLYDLQGEICGQGRTNEDGMSNIKVDDQIAYALKISKNNQVTFLGLDIQHSNSLSEFDISGERSETESGYFVYTERGIYRPGDSLHINLMINRRTRNLPPGLPLIMRFYNTDNHIIDEQIQSVDLNKNQIYTFLTSTLTQAKTGIYTCVFSLGTEEIRKNIRVETIRPNSTSIRLYPDHMTAQGVEHNKLSGEVQLSYLTGFEIPNAKIQAYGLGRTQEKPFYKFGDYSFNMSTQVDNSLDIFNVTTNANGKARFECNYDFKTFNLPLILSLDIETTLPGGGFNKEGQTIKINPFESYVGLKNTGGSGWAGNYFLEDKKIFQTVNVDRSGNLSKTTNRINYQVSKHKHFWWVDKYRILQSWNYNQSGLWEKINEGSINITGKGSIDLSKLSLAHGTYKIRAIDEKSGHIAETYFVVYDANKPIPGLEPHILEFDLESDECTGGDKVKLKLPAIQDAKVLISIEQGNQILQQSWATLENKETEFIVKTEESWAPNVYIHLTVIQPYMQENNHLPLRMYGLKSLKVNPQLPDLKPVISTVSKFESNKQYEITVHENEGKAMEYTLAVVDEGLLNISGFQTPDPANHFSGKFPLLVKTWDIYKYLMRYFKARYAGIISIGGDDTYNPDALPEINRFKPVSKQFGPFQLFAGEKRKHNIDIPNYIGKVRIMVVAASSQKFGKAEKYVEVKNPIMLQAQFPRSLNISDTLQLPVTIFRDDASITSAVLKASATPGMLGGLTPTVPIKMDKEQSMHRYKIHVLEKSGKLVVDLNLTGGSKTMKEQTEMAVHYPHPYHITSEDIVLDAGEEKTIKIDPKGYVDVFQASVSVAGARLPDFSKYAEELQQYPYGCLEQIISSGFAQLYLDKILLLSPEENRTRIDHLQTVIQKMSFFRGDLGRFNYWPNGSYSAWADLYTGHFLIEAKKLNYLPANSNLLTTWLDSQIKSAGKWRLQEASSQHTYEYESMIQAYRLYILAKAGRPAKSAMNLFATGNTSKNHLTWWLMAGAYVLSGYESKALELIQKAETMMGENRGSNAYSYYHFGGIARNLAIIVEVLAQIPQQSEKKNRMYQWMVDELDRSQYVNTQAMGFAYCAAYYHFGAGLNQTKNVDYEWVNNGQSASHTHSSLQTKNHKIEKADWGKDRVIRNKGTGKLYLKINKRFIPKELYPAASNSQISMKVNYSQEKNKATHLNGVKQGDYVNMSITISNLSGVPQEYLALNLKMPSGYELINPNIYESTIRTSGVQSEYTYMDFRDDRVYTFFNIAPGEKKTYHFKAKASFIGNFYLPSINCEHMYNGEIYARTKAGRAQILD